MPTGSPEMEATALLSRHWATPDGELLLPVDPIYLARQLGMQVYASDLDLRRVFGYVLLSALVAQIVIANGIFVIYVIKNDWHVDGTTIQVWLIATVVQVIGLAGVVVKYLFSADAAPR